MIDEELGLDGVGVDVGREVEDDVHGGWRLGAHRTVDQIAIEEAKADRSIPVERLRFERRVGSLHETPDRRGAVGGQQPPHYSAPDEAGGSRDEKGH